MAAKNSKVAAAKKLASKINSKKKTTKKSKLNSGQNAPQSSVYKKANDKKVEAKPVGYRWTDAGAKRLGKSATSKPTNADVEKYSGKTFKFKGEDTRYLYSEKRVDKSDVSKSAKLEEGGTLGAGSFKLGGGVGVKGRQYDPYNKKQDGEREAKPAGWRFTDRLAKRLGKSSTARPTLEQIERYKGKGVYYERRQDKADTKPQKKFLSFELGGETPDELLHIKHVYVDVYEDDYEKGEGEFVNTYEMKDLRGAKVKASEIVKWAEKYVGTSGNASNYLIIDGRIDTAILQDEDGNELSKYQIEEWKKGKKKAYNARYSIFLEAIKSRDITDDEELSKATGISLYEQGGELNGSNITGAGMFKKGGGLGVKGRQYDPYNKKQDGEREAKPAGWRFTNRLAKRLGKSSTARPTLEQIEKYEGRGVYYERRQDKADTKPQKKYISLEQGGEMMGSDIQGAGMFAGGGGVHRVSNSESREYSENMMPFRANNLEGKTLSNGDYVVLSYGYYPIWYYSSKESKWYGNKDKYSQTTAKHISQSRPTYDAEMLGKAELLDKMMNQNATFENGGEINVLSADVATSPIQTVGGTQFSTGDLTSNLTIDSLGY